MYLYKIINISLCMFISCITFYTIEIHTYTKPQILFMSLRIIPSFKYINSYYRIYVYLHVNNINCYCY